MRTAIAFTGGVDSTFLLWKILSETSDVVQTFRIDYRNAAANNRFNFSQAEEMASVAVVSWLKSNVRDFTHTIININEFQPLEWSSIEAARIGGGLLRDDLADRFMIGRNAEATWTVAEIDADPSKKNVLRRQLEVLREVVPGGTLEQPLKDAGLGKAHAWRDLPAALMALTLKCKQPTITNGLVVECGKCPTGCVFHTMIQSMVVQGYDTDLITDYVHKTTRRGAYVGLPGIDHLGKRASIYVVLKQG